MPSFQRGTPSRSILRSILILTGSSTRSCKVSEVSMPSNKSRVLILTICSNLKTREGESDKYQSTGAISECVREQDVRLLFDGRRRVCALITSDRVSRDGKLLRDLPYNGSLVEGPDIQLRGITKGGMYLPAAKRYRGRFYVALGPDGPSLLTDTQHHVLIISGLYGLLTPLELIQCYSCNVSDHPTIAKFWTQDDRLTSVLVAYIQAFGITKVFDFMAVDAYRSLVSWEMIRHATKGNVLHCFSRQFAGDALLPSLGTLAEKLLTRPESGLLNIKAGDSEKIPDDEVLFHPFSTIPDKSDIAHETKRQTIKITKADKIGRIRRNILKMLGCALDPDDTSYGFGQRVKKLRTRGNRYDREITDLMQWFEEKRNLVEYEGYEPYDRDWQRICSDYDEIERWAHGKKYTDKLNLEEIDL